MTRRCPRAHALIRHRQLQAAVELTSIKAAAPKWPMLSSMTRNTDSQSVAALAAPAACAGCVALALTASSILMQRAGAQTSNDSSPQAQVQVPNRPLTALFQGAQG